MIDAAETRVKELFDSAVELEGAEREAFLAKACAGSPSIRARVDALLAASEKGDSFLSDTARLRGARPAEADASEAVGSILGHYRLAERIGEGGFGSVFLAEQTEPVRRRVALKIVKLGMDTRAVVSRFEQERDALALMDHPNIARVFDAGVTPTGRPYFVMEFVEGEPITAFCDHQKQTIAERIALFRQVCAAIQHSHIKGIVHRDIKPGNVLVRMQEGRAVAKVIDFGIAKALGGGAAPGATRTEIHGFLGTPDYMSPEQASGSRDIDTRTDVYSLGVLLYELLSGLPPFDREKLHSSGYTEVLATICETEPPRPSDRFARSGARRAEIAAARAMEPARVEAQVRGDLDWIVLRAIAKDPARRYGSAEALDADLERHESGLAVEAHPPSASYRLRKLVKRRRGPILAGALVFLALVGGTIGTGMGLLTAKEETARARQEAAVSFATLTLLTRDLLEAADTGVTGGRPNVTVRELLDRAAARLASGAALRDVDPEARVTVTVAVQCAISRSYRALGLFDQAEVQAKSALALARAMQPAEPALLAEALVETGEVHRIRLERDAALRDLREALAIGEKLPGDQRARLATYCNAVAGAEMSFGNVEKAEPQVLRSIVLYKEVRGESSVEVATMLGNLAQIRLRQERVDEAIQLLREAHEIHKKERGENDVTCARDIYNLGWVLQVAGRASDSVPPLREAIQRMTALYNENHPTVASCKRHLGYALVDLGRAEEAIPLLRSALEIDRKLRAPTSFEVAEDLNGLGEALLAAREVPEAERVFTELTADYESSGVAIHGQPWHIDEAKGRIGAAIVDSLDPKNPNPKNGSGVASAPAEASASRLATAGERFRRAETLLVESFRRLDTVPAGRERSDPESDSRRAVAAERIVRLYELWRARAGEAEVDADRKKLDDELARWKVELASRRTADAIPTK